MRRLEDLFGLDHRNHDRYGRNDSMRIYFRGASFCVYRYGSANVEIRCNDAETVVRITELVKTLKTDD